MRERGYHLDEKEFNAELQKQKVRSRAASVVISGDWQIIGKEEPLPFIGYDTTEADAKITRIRKVESKKDGEMYQVVLSNTPFYPEGGGKLGIKVLS